MKYIIEPIWSAIFATILCVIGIFVTLCFLLIAAWEWEKPNWTFVAEPYDSPYYNYKTDVSSKYRYRSFYHWIFNIK